MKFYLLDDPAKPEKFARFSHVGTWSKGSLCENCGVTTEKLVEPLQIEWNKGTDVIGSFSWCGYHCVVTDEVRAFLKEARAGCAFGRVEVVPPKEKTARRRVPFPYTGPHLHWLIPTKRVRLDEAGSGVHLLADCSSCGQRRFNFKPSGLIIRASAARDTSMFLIEQFGRSRATFISEQLLAGLKSQGFSNLCPRLAGIIES